MNIKQKRYLLVVTLFLSLALWSWFLSVMGIEQIIDFLGIENPFLFIFLVSLFSGASIFTSGIFYTILAALALEGHAPLLLGIFSGLGLVLGDSIYFFLGRGFGQLEEVKKNWLYQKLHGFLKDKPDWAINGFVLFYASFVPLPNDVLLLVLGAVRKKFLGIFLLLLLGDIILATLVALGVFRLGGS